MGHTTCRSLQRQPAGTGNRATEAYAIKAGEKVVPMKQLHVVDTSDDNLVLQRINTELGKGVRQPQPATFTNWNERNAVRSMRWRWPTLRCSTLPSKVASKCLNVGIDRYNQGADENKADNLNLLFHVNGGLVLRALTTEVYERIWNYEVSERLLMLQDSGWEPARPDFNADDKEPDCVVCQRPRHGDMAD